jgi:hypothetical protein
MNEVITHHGHHKISAAVFVGSLILGCAMILAAELTKPPRYEYHTLPNATTAGEYLLYDNETGAATLVNPGTKNPASEMNKETK